MKAIGSRLIFVVSLVVGIVALAGRAAPAEHGDSDPAHDHLHHHHFAEFAKVPEKARARLNPLENDPDAVAAGRKLFLQHCAECHGNTAEGGRKAPNLRAEEVQYATAGTLFWILTNGVVRKGMPVWSKLPEPERWQIVTFIKSLPPPTGSAALENSSTSHSTPDATVIRVPNHDSIQMD
jgi:cytochrome c